MDLSKLNEFGNQKFAPTRNRAAFKIKQNYPVIEIEEVQTKKFGKKFVAVMEENGEAFDVFLPKRICDLFFEDKKVLDDLRDAANKLKLFAQSSGSGTIEFSII